MLEKINVRGIASLEEIKDRANQILSLYKSCIKEVKLEYPNVEFSVSTDADPFCKIFIIGNKKVGSDYDLNTWKSVPCLRLEMRQFSSMHPSTPGLYFLDVGYNYAGYNGSEDWCKGEEEAKKQIMSGLRNAIKDFTVQGNNKL